MVNQSSPVLITAPSEAFVNTQSAGQAKAVADKIGAQVSQKQQANEIIARQLEIDDCTKPFRSSDMGKIRIRRMQCGQSCGE